MGDNAATLFTVDGFNQEEIDNLLRLPRHFIKSLGNLSAWRMSLKQGLMDIKLRGTVLNGTEVEQSRPIRAHRIILALSSPYFAQVLRKHSRSFNCPLIPIPGVYLAELVNYMYTGKFPELTEDNIVEYIRSCHLLELEEGLNKCLLHLVHNKSAESVLKLLQNNLSPEAFYPIKDALTQSLDKFLKTESFLKISLEQLQEITTTITSMEILEMNPILEAILSWVLADVSQREVHFFGLIKVFPVSKLPHEFLKNSFIKMHSAAQRKYGGVRQAETPAPSKHVEQVHGNSSSGGQTGQTETSDLPQTAAESAPVPGPSKPVAKEEKSSNNAPVAKDPNSCNNAPVAPFAPKHLLRHQLLTRKQILIPKRQCSPQPQLGKRKWSSLPTTEKLSEDKIRVKVERKSKSPVQNKKFRLEPSFVVEKEIGMDSSSEKSSSSKVKVEKDKSCNQDTEDEIYDAGPELSEFYSHDPLMYFMCEENPESYCVKAYNFRTKETATMLSNIALDRSNFGLAYHDQDRRLYVIGGKNNAQGSHGHSLASILTFDKFPMCDARNVIKRASCLKNSALNYTKYSLQQPRCNFGTVRLEKLFVIGGNNSVAGGSSALSLKSVEMRQENGQWFYSPSMKEARESFGVTAVNNNIYVAGGLKGTSSTPLSSFERYCPEVNAWKALLPLTTKSINPRLVGAENHLIYALNGSNRVHTSQNRNPDVEMYDVRENKWTPICMKNSGRLFPRGAAAIHFMNSIVSIGGRQNAKDIPVVEVLDLRNNTWSSEATLPDGGIFSSVVFSNVPQ